MAIFNEILTGRYNRALQKIFAIKGSPPVRQLGGEVTPAVTLFYGVENRYLEGWNRFAWSFQNGPSAAQTNGMRLRNPAGSNIVAIIEKCSMFSSNAGIFLVVSIGDSNPDLETIAAIAPAPLDSRQGSLGSHTSQLVASTSALSPAIQRPIFEGHSGPNGTVVNDMILTEDMEVPILPNRSITIQQVGVNTILVGNFIWRERLLEESERT
jgi:hypothetical protein